MEPAMATSYLVAGDAPPRPAPQTAQLGQGLARPGWGRWALLAVVFLFLASSFAWGGHLLLFLFLFLAGSFALGLGSLAGSSVFLFLANVIGDRVTDAMPNGGLKIAVWVLTNLGIGVRFYFFFLREGAGRRPDGRALHEVSTELRV